MRNCNVIRTHAFVLHRAYKRTVMKYYAVVRSKIYHFHIKKKKVTRHVPCRVRHTAAWECEGLIIATSGYTCTLLLVIVRNTYSSKAHAIGPFGYDPQFYSFNAPRYRPDISRTISGPLLPKHFGQRNAQIYN